MRLRMLFCSTRKVNDLVKRRLPVLNYIDTHFGHCMQQFQSKQERSRQMISTIGLRFIDSWRARCEVEIMYKILRILIVQIRRITTLYSRHEFDESTRNLIFYQQQEIYEFSNESEKTK